ncbi:hypothetical protein GCM10022258_31040 [Aquimarina gracilis]
MFCLKYEDKSITNNLAFAEAGCCPETGSICGYNGKNTEDEYYTTNTGICSTDSDY